MNESLALIQKDITKQEAFRIKLNCGDERFRRQVTIAVYRLMLLETMSFIQIEIRFSKLLHLQFF